VTVAATAAGTDHAASLFMKGIMENNDEARTVIRTAEQLDPEQHEQLLAALRERKRRVGTADRHPWPSHLRRRTRTAPHAQRRPAHLAALALVRSAGFSPQKLPNTVNIHIIISRYVDFFLEPPLLCG
jgi:hypothetical protein